MEEDFLLFQRYQGFAIAWMDIPLLMMGPASVKHQPDSLNVVVSLVLSSLLVARCSD